MRRPLIIRPSFFRVPEGTPCKAMHIRGQSLEALREEAAGEQLLHGVKFVLAPGPSLPHAPRNRRPTSLVIQSMTAFGEFWWWMPMVVSPGAFARSGQSAMARS